MAYTQWKYGGELKIAQPSKTTLVNSSKREKLHLVLQV